MDVAIQLEGHARELAIVCNLDDQSMIQNLLSTL